MLQQSRCTTLKPIFFKELRRYSAQYLMNAFKLEEQKFEVLISILTQKKVFIKEKSFFKINYVGFFIFNNRLCFSFPKYTKEENDNEQLITEIINLFQEYSSRENLEEEEIETFGDLNDQEEFNLISIIFFLFQDYLDNNLYTNEIKDVEIDGEGDINWDRTVDNMYAYNLNNRSIYLNFHTNRSINDTNNIITKIHKYILNECTLYVNETGLRKYLNFPSLHFDIDREEIGSLEFMLYNIQNEMSTQYNDRKLYLLNIFQTFLLNKGSASESNSLALFGTKSFHVVWEKVCSFVFNNIYSKIKDQNYIDKPMWKENITNVLVEAERTLTPDVLTSFKKGEDKYFLVLDAKYYNTRFKGNAIHNTPQLEDITKQYLYELALKTYCEQEGYTSVINAFLLPNADDLVEDIGIVSINFLKNLSLQDIKLIKLPASRMYKYYAQRKQLSDQEIEQIFIS